MTANLTTHADQRATMMASLDRVNLLAKRVSQGVAAIMAVAVVALTIWAVRTDSSVRWLIGMVLAPVAWIQLNRIAQIVMVGPVRGMTDARIRKQLVTGLAQYRDRIVSEAHWPSNGPGMVAVLQGGEMLLVDAAGGYDFDPIPASQVVGAQVERKTTMHSTSKQSGGTAIAVPLGGGMAGAVSSGKRSTTTTRVEEQAYLDVRIERQPGGPISCHTIWFGDSISEAETMAAAINRLAAQARPGGSATPKGDA